MAFKRNDIMREFHSSYWVERTDDQPDPVPDAAFVACNRVTAVQAFGPTPRAALMALLDAEGQE
jgi:hypothetical protein